MKKFNLITLILLVALSFVTMGNSCGGGGGGGSSSSSNDNFTPPASFHIVDVSWWLIDLACLQQLVEDAAGIENVTFQQIADQCGTETTSLTCIDTDINLHWLVVDLQNPNQNTVSGSYEIYSDGVLAAADYDGLITWTIPEPVNSIIAMGYLLPEFYNGNTYNVEIWFEDNQGNTTPTYLFDFTADPCPVSTALSIEDETKAEPIVPEGWLKSFSFESFE